MPNAPWATTTTAPTSAGIIPKQDPSVYVTASTNVADTGINQWVSPGAEALVQLNSLLAGDPAEAQKVLSQMGWQGTVEQFKALTPAQQAAFAHDNGTHGRNRWGRSGDPILGAFARNPDGTYDFTKWYDGSPSGYDSNLMPLEGQNPPDPGRKAAERLVSQWGLNTRLSVDPTMGGQVQTANVAPAPTAPQAPQIGNPQPPTIGQPPVTPQPPVITQPTPANPPSIRQPQSVMAPYIGTNPATRSTAPTIRNPSNRNI